MAELDSRRARRRASAILVIDTLVRRIPFLIALLAVVPIGLLTKWYGGPGAVWFNRYGGQSKTYVHTQAVQAA